MWDLVERDGTVVDNKAYRKTPYQEDLDKDLPFTIYALGFRATRGEIETGLRMDAIVKRKNPKVVQLHTRRTNSDCRWVLGLIEQVGKAITSGIFYSNPNGRHCTPRFCGYATTCHKFQGSEARIIVIPVFDPYVYESARQTGATDVTIANFVGFFIEDLQGNSVLGRMVPMTGLIRNNGGPPIPNGAFLQAIHLVE